MNFEVYCDESGLEALSSKEAHLYMGIGGIIIRFTGKLKAKLVTAYQKEDIENILSAPDFEKTDKFFGA